MVNFLKKRLQVFVSSTYLDLKQERQAAVSAILTSGHIPAGMELFTAGDESQMTVIKQWIDESDVFLLILGSRYGSIEPNTGRSYTHLEYDYALSQNKPLFACVINNQAIDERVKKLGRSCLEQDNPQKLKEFREFTLTKLSGFWSDTKDIQLEVIKALQNFSRREDLTGWVKGNEAIDPVALTEELTRLSQENANLRQENQDVKKQDNNSLNSSQLGISHEQMKQMLEKYYIEREIVIAVLSPENQENLSKYELKKQKKISNLLDLFLIIIDDLILGNNSTDPMKLGSKIWEIYYGYLLKLCEKNLLYHNRGGNFRIKDEGSKFLNWLEYQELNK